MAKKKVAKRKQKTEKVDGEQLDLIDVAPENAKPIIAMARAYKKVQAVRQAALREEIGLKQKIIELVRAADLQPLEGGKIKFEYDDVIVTVTPRDELVKVKDRAEEAQGD